MSRNLTQKISLLVAALVIVLLSGCEKKETPQTPRNVVSVPEISKKPIGPAETGVPTSETTPPKPITTPSNVPANTAATTTPEALKNVVFRIYEDENQPDKYVELSEFKTACPEVIGNLFGTGILTMNPTLPDEKRVPVERVASIELVNMGLIDPDIKGVGKITQPIGYRDCKIILKNPDENLTGIVVLCRNLEGKKTDGTPWALLLKQTTAKNFYKIVLIKK